MTLAERYPRELFERLYLEEGKSRQEIAAELSLPLGTIASMLTRYRIKLPTATRKQRHAVNALAGVKARKDAQVEKASSLEARADEVLAFYRTHSLDATAKEFCFSMGALRLFLEPRGAVRMGGRGHGAALLFPQPPTAKEKREATWQALLEDKQLAAKVEQLFIGENKSLQVTAETCGLTVSVLRKLLSELGLKKTTEAYHKTAQATYIERYSEEAWRERFVKAKKDPKKVRDGHRRKGITRRAANQARYTEEGMTEEALRDLYLTQNLSLNELCEHFAKPKGTMRKILFSCGISKPPALVKAAKERVSAELYSDPERVAAMVQKTKTTCRERYGEHWYYNNASQWEHRLKELLEQALPGILIEQSVYNLIRQPGSGGALQLDLYFPQARVAVEANGEYWHDRALWEQDQEEGTELSREQLKTRLCEEKDILLLHLWDSTWKAQPEEELTRIVAAVEGRLPTELQEAER